VNLPRDLIIEYKYIIVQFAKTIKVPADCKKGRPIPQFPPDEIQSVIWENFGNGSNRRLNTFDKKEIVLYEEMNSTKVVEEYVEDKSNHHGYNLPEKAEEVEETKKEAPAPVSVGENSVQDLNIGAGPVFQMINSKKSN